MARALTRCSDSDSGLQAAQQLKVVASLPSKCPNHQATESFLAFFPARYILGELNYSVEQVRGAESMSTVRTITRAVQKRFKPGLHWVNHLYTMRSLQQEAMGGNDSLFIC